MKVLPFRIPKSSDASLIIQEDFANTFYGKFHQHEEIQISLILEGEGQLIVGDTINDYKVNDLLVIGSNVPHMFKSDENSEAMSHMISLFFTKSSFGDDFFNLPEFDTLESFFIDAQHSFKINASDNPKQIGGFAIKKFIKYDKLDRLIHFLKLLKIINESKKEYLSSFVHKKQYTDNEGRRMSAVFQLAMNEFYRDITLQEVADISSMTPNAFCRYFKNRTDKTFFQFLIEVRVEHACKLLSKRNDLSIAEIAYQCGFKNISNFNRKFKGLKEITPSKYRKKAYALKN